MSTSDGSIQGVTKIIDHGPDSARWNLVILGDGYQSGELTTYAADALAFVNTLRVTAPFDTLWPAINVHRVDVSSTDSGAADPVACGGTGVTPKTYFDATFCGDGQIQRLLTVNTTTARSVATAQVPQMHMTIVIVNSTIYGGSGGQVAVFSKAANAPEIAIHEMGHTAFGLADEYEYFAGCASGETGHDRYTGAEPTEPNVTANANRATIKWSSLIANATAVPTTSNANCAQCDTQSSPVPANTVGAFEGARYFHCAMYRPQFNCRMRKLGNPFCAVCQQAVTSTISPFMPAVPTLVTAIADSGNFGSACLGSFTEQELTINNAGTRPLLISSITSSSAEFVAPAVVSYPLVVSPGGSLEVVIRFQPSSLGAKTAIITLFSNDPAGARTVSVHGMAPAPRLSLLIANAGNFGNVCVESFADKPLTLSNSGRCTLTITTIASSENEFLVPQVLAFPLTIGAGDALEIPIRFQPAGFGSKSATITIASDDPAGPKTITVVGNAPSGKLAVTGSLCFGGVKACCRADRTISVCNVGDCKLHVTSVAFKRKNRHWKLINNPFPATLHPGSCLGVVIRYKATEKCPICCELVITSDDPITPVKTLDVMAYTIWNECCCKQCCDDCRNGCCNKRHTECCCEGRADDCCQDEEDEDEDES